ncbi:MAG: alpha/beta fold hydrolase [Firmicutes bacterium]|nr:alpha/beta fold hydrolase [Bacillota bacterium]
MRQEMLYPDHSGAGQIYAQIFLPEKRPFRGILQVVHGMNDYGSRYAGLADFLNAQGWVVAAADHFGHGKSLPPGASLGSLPEENGWLHLLEDVLSFQQQLRALYPDLPFFLMGHSMGSFLLRDLLSHFSDPCDGLILSGSGSYRPGLCSTGIFLLKLCALFTGKHGRIPFIQKKMCSVYNHAFRREGHPFSWVSRDTAVCELHLTDPCCSYLPDLDFYGELLRGIRRVELAERKGSPARDIPILLLSGREDPVGGHGRGVSRVYRRFFERGWPVEMLLYPGGRHEMLHEPNREEVYQDILDWLNGILQEKQKENEA